MNHIFGFCYAMKRCYYSLSSHTLCIQLHIALTYPTSSNPYQPKSTKHLLIQLHLTLIKPTSPNPHLSNFIEPLFIHLDPTLRRELFVCVWLLGFLYTSLGLSSYQDQTGLSNSCSNHQTKQEKMV